jgi:hypothetical protein
MTKAVWGVRIRLVGALACAVLASSCGDMTREGTAPSYLILTSLAAAPGNKVGTFGSFLLSDVVTVVDNVVTFFNDPGQATFQLALKDPGPSSSPNTPSINNAITLTQYHVEFIRTDGRKVQGVDVPFAFDGTLTTTVSGAATSVGFALVRHSAKQEAPLAALAFSNEPITTIARVTFYGHDQTGREVSVTGTIDVTFWNFADE